MTRLLLATAACFLLATPVLAQQSCPPSLEGHWIDEASSDIKGKPNQVTGFILRRQGEGYYLTTIFDYGARAVPRGYFASSAGELSVERVLGYDDLMTMFAGTVVGPLAVNALADQRIKIKRVYRLSPDGDTVEISGETVSASVRPDGTLDSWRKQPLRYKSYRAEYPKPCAREQHAAGWDALKAKANAWRDRKDKPPLSDEVRQHGMLGLDAVNAKNMEQSVDEFEAGLALDPLWPTGQYDAAMSYAQMMDYENAAYHMRAYLELCPTDDKDMQANQDRLLLWEGKLKQQISEKAQPGSEDDD
jgi:hypothetical protein